MLYLNIGLSSTTESCNVLQFPYPVVITMQIINIKYYFLHHLYRYTILKS